MTAREALDRTILLTRDFVRVDEATDEEILEALLAVDVTIVSDASNLSHASGQTLVVSLTTQLLQMGARIRLAIPEVPLLGPQPPLIGGELRRGLIDFADDLVPGVTASVSAAVDTGGMTFVVGDTPCRDDLECAWRVCGGRWWGSTAPIGEMGSRWTEEFPIGAIIGACIAAAEPYKAAVRGLLKSRGISRRYEELERTTAARVALEDEALQPLTILHPCDFISGGAITNAALFAMFRVPGVSGSIRLLEPDRLDVTNLNRYALARRHHVHEFKADVLASYAPPGVRLTPLHVLFDKSTLPAIRPLAPMVAVGTDAIPPRWLGVGSTAHFMTLTSSHAADGTCAACLHPRDDSVVATIPTISFVSFWAGLLLTARLLASRNGACVPDREAHILWPLRLDLPAAQRWYRTPRAADCPLGHLP